MNIATVTTFTHCSCVAIVKYPSQLFRLQDEEDTASPNKVPLLKQLNTFFLSRHGRKRTNHSLVPSNKLFPHIHSQCSESNHDLGDMTAASIINYRVPSANRRPPNTSHPRLSVQKNMETKHSPMFKPMIERQKIQMFPMRMKAITTSSLKQYDAPNSPMQTTNSKRFNNLNLRPALPLDKGLPKSHVLTAKHIKNKVPVARESVTEIKIPIRELTPLSDISDNTKGGRWTTPLHQRTLHNILLNNYGRPSMHPFLTPHDEITRVDKSFGKAELVDYGSIATSNNYHT